ncbi:uncharacterized protein GLRG_07070 [Colletotrichum graminicola M1.001]|uniref:Uncharacterized protein n=1 Tax=Colletotrichum graminicola (strain M1.001 / M2 / FGSC 10212) TaxID=645133 RepID=E3QM38_COLGM|nr:uncharacterized protein GLRG_07070 [Colletotrichum graminicola M1.001]EFQ31926.1 hypothetical protein GLRG_07070 [Colletotrichum graminicola M1.001]
MMHTVRATLRAADDSFHFSWLGRSIGDSEAVRVGDLHCANATYLTHMPECGYWGPIGGDAVAMSCSVEHCPGGSSQRQLLEQSCPLLNKKCDRETVPVFCRSHTVMDEAAKAVEYVCILRSFIFHDHSSVRRGLKATSDTGAFPPLEPYTR